MATGDSLLNERPADCGVAPGDAVVLERLPRQWFHVAAVLQRVGEEYNSRFLIEVHHPTEGVVFLWHDDKTETFYRLVPLEKGS